MSTDEAIDLIWKGEYDTAERALQGHLRSGENGSSRAELLVYLAYIASIRQEQVEARTLLQEALEASPGLALSPVEFPKAMRDLLTDLRTDLFAQKPRPARGALEAKSVLAPEATPLAWKSGGSKWYASGTCGQELRRWSQSQSWRLTAGAVAQGQRRRER